MHFDYEIKYIPGISNVIADGLSRPCIDDTTEVPVIQFTEPCIRLESLESEYQARGSYRTLNSVLSTATGEVSVRVKNHSSDLNYNRRQRVYSSGIKTGISTVATKTNDQSGSPISQWYTIYFAPDSAGIYLA